MIHPTILPFQWNVWQLLKWLEEYLWACICGISNVFLPLIHCKLHLHNNPDYRLSMSFDQNWHITQGDNNHVCCVANHDGLDKIKFTQGHNLLWLDVLLAGDWGRRYWQPSHLPDHESPLGIEWQRHLILKPLSAMTRSPPSDRRVIWHLSVSSDLTS